MLITQILHSDCVKVPVENKDKESVITELIDILDAKGFFTNRDAVLEAVLTRERTQSTGIGAGMAIPHGKSSETKELVMAIGIANKPIEFESIDGKPVKIIFLLVSPTTQTGLHIQALAAISRLMMDAEFKTKLENATSADEVYELFSESEND
ncbi:MAG: PTS sugar transporter subunit IIA [Sedimentisphaerales bacterium]|nr:PTS sugar transporter subunit IIA [Sedimentisphaerales bacterium]